MEPNEKEKTIDWKEIKLCIKLMLTFLFLVISPLLIIIHSEKIAKTMNTSIDVAIIMGFATILGLGIIIVGLLENKINESESSKPNKKDYVNCIEIEIQGRKHYITQELYNRLGKRGVPTLGEVLSLPPKTKRTSQVPTDIQHFIKDKENTTSRVTPLPTKQETPKHVNKESMREFIENHVQRMADLDYISEEIDKNKYPITQELKSLLKNGYRNKNLRKDFDDYIRNNPPKGFTVETFDLTKNINQPSVAPRGQPYSN